MKVFESHVNIAILPGSYGDYIGQITDLMFIRIADERSVEIFPSSKPARPSASLPVSVRGLGKKMI